MIFPNFQKFYILKIFYEYKNFKKLYNAYNLGKYI